MLVHFLTDEPTKIPAIRAMLGPQHDVAPQVLGDGSTSVISNGVLMVDADLRKAAPVEQIKLVLHDLRDVSEKLFVVQRHLHHMVAQAFALGATAVVSRPKEIVSKLAEIEVAQKAAQAASANASPEITHSAAAFGHVLGDTGRQAVQAFGCRERHDRDHQQHRAKRTERRGWTTCAAIMKERSSTACW